MKTTFKEHKDPSYVGRTKENASCDVTIAIASNFNSAGERLTKKLVEDQKKIYIPVHIDKILNLSEDLIDFIVKKLNHSLKGNILDPLISLNIAGNGIYTLKSQYSQPELDEYVYKLLSKVLTNSNIRIKIKSINSGGQTGIDEAGIKAGKKLGIDTFVICPKGWKYRNIKGEDVMDELLFKERFDG